MEDPPALSRHHFRDDGEIVKTTTYFTPFLLAHGLDSALPIEGQIPSPCLVKEILPDTSPLEEPLLILEQDNEDLRATLQII